MPYERVSFIDDLPDLERLESEEKQFRQIRNKKTISEESGMSVMGAPPMQPTLPFPQQYQYSQHPDYPIQIPDQVPLRQNPDMYVPQLINAKPMTEQQAAVSQPMNQASYSPPQVIEPFVPEVDCRAVFDHISRCPICKKFYQHDNTMYIVVIIILLLLCALLLKKVLKI